VHQPEIPTADPLRIAADTWLVPNLLPAGPDAFVPVSSMVITGAEPVLVDTGAPVHRAAWLEAAFSIVDPADVRWVFVSHEDVDHIGNLDAVLERCPNATLVASFFYCERMASAGRQPLDRMRWVEPGDTIDAGDRLLHAVLPPLFDNPTTRGLFDERTGVLWAADAFACPTPGAVFRAEDLPPAMVDEAWFPFNSLAAPWHEWLDGARYRAHVDRVEALGLTAVASCHGPVLTGAAVADAFERTRAMAGAPRAAAPGQPLLDQLLAAA
jgi:flavorubredoxin